MVRWAREQREQEEQRGEPPTDPAEYYFDKYWWGFHRLDLEQDPGTDEETQRLAYAIRTKGNTTEAEIDAKRGMEEQFKEAYYSLTTEELREWRAKEWRKKRQEATVTLEDISAYKTRRTQTLSDESEGVCSKYGEMIDKIEQIQHEQDMQGITLNNIQEDVGLIKDKWVMTDQKKPLDEIMEEGKDIPEPLQRIEKRLEGLEKAIITMAESSSRALYRLHHKE